MEAIVQTEKVSRIYKVGGREVAALQGISFAARPGQTVALRGRSGSAKTTLLNCIGGLDRPTAGQVWVDGRNVTNLSEPQQVRLRRQRPTGALDTATGQQILHLFRQIANTEGTTILIATHDLAVDAFADEVYVLQDGRIVA